MLITALGVSFDAQGFFLLLRTLVGIWQGTNNEIAQSPHGQCRAKGSTALAASSPAVGEAREAQSGVRLGVPACLSRNPPAAGNSGR